MLRYRCQNCGQKIRSRLEFAGKLARCPTCTHVSRVPAAPQSPQPDPAPPPEDERESILGRLVPVLERSGLATAAEIRIETMAQRLREEAIALGQCIVFPTLIGAWCRVARG